MLSVHTKATSLLSLLLVGTAVSIQINELDRLKPTNAYAPFDLTACKFNTVVCCYTKQKNKPLERGQFDDPPDNVDVCSATDQDYHCHVSLFD
jgi:hypothetical protein